MSKQAAPPPTGDKATPTAPPGPPAWRHYLWPLAIILSILLFLVVPATQSQQVTITYSQFLKDVYYSSAPDPTKKLGNSEVTQALKRANVEPSNYALFAYASVQALVAAMEGTNVGGADAMADWLRKNSVNSAVGKLAWNDKGDVVDFQFDFFAFDSNGRRFEYR